MKWPSRVFTWLAVAGGLRLAAACPYCDTETGRQVRVEIFNEHFWGNAAATVLPLAVLLCAVALIRFDLSKVWAKKTRD